MECGSEEAPASVLVARDASQEAGQLIGGLGLIASAKCVAVAEPFLCLYLFGGVCDENGVNYLPTSAECLEISTGVCQVEWELGRTAGFPLPDCSTLPEENPPSICSNTSLDDNDMNDMFINSKSRLTE